MPWVSSAANRLSGRMLLASLPVIVWAGCAGSVEPEPILALPPEAVSSSGDPTIHDLEAELDRRLAAVRAYVGESASEGAPKSEVADLEAVCSEILSRIDASPDLRNRAERALVVAREASEPVSVATESETARELLGAATGAKADPVVAEAQQIVQDRLLVAKPPAGTLDLITEFSVRHRGKRVGLDLFRAYAENRTKAEDFKSAVVIYHRARRLYGESRWADELSGWLREASSKQAESVRARARAIAERNRPQTQDTKVYVRGDGTRTSTRRGSGEGASWTADTSARRGSSGGRKRSSC